MSKSAASSLLVLGRFSINLIQSFILWYAFSISSYGLVCKPKWAIANCFKSNEKISTFLPLPLDENQWDKLYVIFATKNGMVRKNKLIDIAKSGKRELRERGKLAIKLKQHEQIIGIKLANK